MSIRVLIADDQSLVRAGFRKLLESEPTLDVVGEAADGTEAIELASRLDPDVILMDIRMPHSDGVEATRRLVGARTETRVIILTTYDLDEYVFDAVRAGASGFLLKDSTPEQLIEGIRVAARGDALLSPSITRRLIREFAESTFASHREFPELKGLTSRELEVLRLVAEGLTNAEIAERLVLGESTVKTHVGNMLMKLGLRDRVQAVVLAYETGLVRTGHSGT